MTCLTWLWMQESPVINTKHNFVNLIVEEKKKTLKETLKWITCYYSPIFTSWLILKTVILYKNVLFCLRCMLCFLVIHLCASYILILFFLVLTSRPRTFNFPMLSISVRVLVSCYMTIRTIIKRLYLYLTAFGAPVIRSLHLVSSAVFLGVAGML